MATGRASVRDTLERHWAMFAMIPTNGWIDTNAIHTRLERLGFDVTPRQVQTDLARYLDPASPFPLRCNATSKPYQYQWSANARLQPIPAMDVQAAVTLDLVRRHLEPLLPPATLDHLQPYFREATRRLQRPHDGTRRLSAWSTKVHVVRDGPPLQARPIDGKLRAAIHEGLLAEQVLEARYRPRGRPAQDYLLSPLGLLLRGTTEALVCLKLDGSYAPLAGPQTFLLHRFDHARRIAVRRPAPPSFDLAAYAATGQFAFQLGPDLELRALVNRDAIASLEESRLSADQRLTIQPDGRYLVEATVPHTYALRVWILGFAEGIEVLEPQALREEIARKLEAAATRYRPTRGK